MSKLTKAQREFLERHRTYGILGKFEGRKNYDFVGRLRDMGFIEIDNGDRIGWPWSWDRTRITPAGLAAISPSPPPSQGEAP